MASTDKHQRVHYELCVLVISGAVHKLEMVSAVRSIFSHASLFAGKFDDETRGQSIIVGVRARERFCYIGGESYREKQRVCNSRPKPRPKSCTLVLVFAQVCKIGLNSFQIQNGNHLMYKCVFVLI